MLNAGCQMFKIVTNLFVDARVWVFVFIYSYMETEALGEEIRIFVKEFERNSVTWSDCKRRSVSFMV